jgi:hypothetical protein
MAETDIVIDHRVPDSGEPIPDRVDPTADWGQPVDDLPPIIEPVAFAINPPPSPPTAVGLRPARRNFLAPVAAPVSSEKKDHASAPTRRAYAGTSKVFAAVARRRRVLAVGAVVVCLIAVGVVVLAGHALFPPRPMHSMEAPPADPTQRIAYDTAAAKAGDRNAQLQLGIRYAKGDGVPQDYATAATWFQAAANQGLARAQYDLGIMYEKGRGVPVDFAAATEWYHKAAEGNYPLAEYNLAVAYTKGQGIRQNLAEAAIWYRRAAGQGVLQAMIVLAMLYERGDGVPASPVDAYAWYLAAGRRDDQPSAKRAEELFSVLSRLDQIRAQALASDVAASIHSSQPERAASLGGMPNSPGGSTASAPAREPATDTGADSKSDGGGS